MNTMRGRSRRIIALIGIRMRREIIESGGLLLRLHLNPCLNRSPLGAAISWPNHGVKEQSIAHMQNGREVIERLELILEILVKIADLNLIAVLAARHLSRDSRQLALETLNLVVSRSQLITRLFGLVGALLLKLVHLLVELLYGLVLVVHEVLNHVVECLLLRLDRLLFAGDLVFERRNLRLESIDLRLVRLRDLRVVLLLKVLQLVQFAFQLEVEFGLEICV